MVKPPYGRVTAIDLEQGSIAWQVAHGETPDNIRNHPALKGLKIPRTGQVGKAGGMVTKTLFIIGAPTVAYGEIVARVSICSGVPGSMCDSMFLIFWSKALCLSNKCMK